ncbi:organic hydroperoxide resistance protein [Pontibacter sp. G13]|uniref:organic hydroperoxide resistance protein n=1 Tax=Pontibacter sp. G13 TaxID=3074898 RepID=UPI002889D972|nr:organic hydroperoxide resistance protein [Pontibacter sp. G13]WNJ18357.1 organic hydroperoxide resistance protein [Pontibacter sp. G13]
MKQLFQTKATAIGGRNGHVRSEDGVIDMDVRIPTMMGGEGGAFTNPEQLFAAGYAACFDNALIHVARLQKVQVQTETTATVGLAMNADQTFALTVALAVKLEGVDAEVAQQLVNKAHATCPYSNAIRGNVDVQIEVLPAPVQA